MNVLGGTLETQVDLYPLLCAHSQDLVLFVVSSVLNAPAVSQYFKLNEPCGRVLCDFRPVLQSFDHGVHICGSDYSALAGKDELLSTMCAYCLKVVEAAERVGTDEGEELTETYLLSVLASHVVQRNHPIVS